MLAASGGFATAVAGTEYYGAWRVQITLPGGVYPDVTLAVEKVTLDAQTVSDMPEGTRLQVGYPSLAAEVTLSGLVDTSDESKTAAWLFGRYSTTSPLYRTDALYCAVTVDLGLYESGAGGTPTFVRKFTGVIDDYTANEDGSVTFTCIDKVRAQLRTVPSLAAVITAPPFNAGLTSEFAIDYLLRRATNMMVSSWPPARNNCILAVGFRSSYWPEVGSLNTSVTQPLPVFGSGALGTALRGNAATGQVTYQTAGSAGADVFLEFWGYPQPIVEIFVGTASGADGFRFDWTGFAGSFEASAVNAGGFTTYSNSMSSNPAQPHYFGIQFHQAVGSATFTVTVRIDNNVEVFNSGSLVAGSRTNSAYDTVTVNVQSANGATVEALQVTNETSPALNATFTPQAVLDPSLNTLDIIPEIAAGDPFQTIQQVADAELAVAGGDESGVFRFYNRATIRGMASQRAITSAQSLTGIGGVETTAAAVVNHATAEYTGWNFASARTTAWSLAKARKVPKGGTLTLKATTSTLFANVDTTATNLAGGSSDVTNSHYRASVDKAGTAEFPSGTLTFTVTQTGSQQLQIVVSNPSGQDAWLVSPANYVDIPVGTPLLRIAALAVTAADTLTADFQYPNPASLSRFGDQAYQITGNPWVQDDTTAATLVQDVVQDMYLPKPNLTGVAIVPDPRIQLIDVVHIQDPDRTGVDEYARVFGWHIDWEADDQGSTYDMTLDARTVALPGAWIGGVAGRSEGALTTWGV